MEKDNSEKYAQILDIIEGMKSGIVSRYTTHLMTTGRMPDSAQRELQVLSQITGAVFSGVRSLGEELVEDADNEELVCVRLNGFKYSCAKVSLGGTLPFTSKDSKEFFGETAKPSSTKESKPVEDDFDEEEKPSEQVLGPEPEPEEENDESFSPSEENMDESAEFGDEEEEEALVPSTPQMTPRAVYDDELTEDDDFGEEEDADDLMRDAAQTDTSMAAKEEAEAEMGGSSSEEEEEEETIRREQNRASIEDARHAVANARTLRENAFQEERSKPIGDMVFNVSKLSVSQIGVGKPEEIIVMMAPLKISKVSIPAVPILVAIFNRGKVVIKTSYDMGDGGKAMVMVDINEMYFLCRGSFDEDGKFKAMVTTTGISATQGVQLNAISSKNYGNSKDSAVCNGHVKVRYEDESGQGTIEVFPFGTEKDDEFIVFVKNPEFSDTYYISPHGRNGSTAKIPCKNGWLDIVPTWNGDVLEVELFEE